MANNNDPSYAWPGPNGETMKKRDFCKGCHNECYWHGTGGSKECWSFENAKVVGRIEASINQMPPYTQSSRNFLDCFNKQGYVHIDMSKLNNEGYFR